MSDLKRYAKVVGLSPSTPHETHQQAHIRPASSLITAPDMDAGQFDATATLIRISQVMALTGIGRATVYKLMSQPESGFPQAVKLTDSKARGAPVAWVLAEVLSWTRARIAARDKVAA